MYRKCPFFIHIYTICIESAVFLYIFTLNGNTLSVAGYEVGGNGEFATVQETKNATVASSEELEFRR